MRVAIALGGNALIQEDQPATAESQRQNLAKAMESLAPILRDHQVIISHGNGPQVGLLSLESLSYKEVKAYPLDVLVAESQGMIGYLIEEALRTALPDIQSAAILTHIEVDPEDEAFSTLTKPIGPYYERNEAARLKEKHGWQFVEKEGKSRRVVASPAPRDISELPIIRALADQRITVICCGGGGIPVAREGGRQVGKEAVIDKDRATGLLAEKLEDDLLMILTDVSSVYVEENGRKRYIKHIHPDRIEQYSFDAGSMGPKVEACIRFARNSGKPAVIGSLSDAERLVSGEAGTTIDPAADSTEYYS